MLRLQLDEALLMLVPGYRRPESWTFRIAPLQISSLENNLMREQGFQ